LAKTSVFQSVPKLLRKPPNASNAHGGTAPAQRITEPPRPGFTRRARAQECGPLQTSGQRGGGDGKAKAEDRRAADHVAKRTRLRRLPELLGHRWRA
jgi:hypothetical protein